MSAEKSNVQVVVRLRPPEDPTESIDDVYVFQPDKPHVLTIRDPLSKGRSDHTFLYSKILLPHVLQEDTYREVARPLVNHCMLGFNSCCFAYGQTGSGKTYSIFGEGASERRGILPRAVEYLFERIEENAERKEIGMVCSFLEVYLDQIRDLGRAYMSDRSRSKGSNASAGSSGPIRTGGASKRPTSATPAGRNGSRPGSAVRPSSAVVANSGPDFGMAGDGQLDLRGWANQDLEIHETPEGQVFVKDLTLVPVRTIQEVMDVVNLGLHLRETHGTHMNASSSRSHTVFTINVVQKDRRAEDADVISGVLNLVDLAGSERIARSKSEGARFQEAVVINSSLSALGRVVLALSQETKDAKFIPYRDSKLTRILQGSLGGNSFTTLLACINPGADNYEESVNTLMFADRCRYMENRPVVNYVDPATSNNDRRVRRLLAEIADLKSQLDISRATAEQKVNFVNENLGANGMPDYLKGLAEADEQTKKAKVELERAQREAAKNLADQLKKTEAAERRAAEMERQFENARKETADREEARRRELLDLRDRMLQLEKDLTQQKNNYEKLMKDTGDQNKAELDLWKDQVQRLLNSKDDLIMRVPELLKDSALLLDTKQAEWKDKNKAMHDRHKHHLHALKDSHEGETDKLVKQYKFFLKEKEGETEELIKNFQQYYDKKKRETAQFEEEMLALYELIQQLTRIIHDMETGQYPVCYKLGMRCVQVPPGVKPPLPAKRKFERLYAAIAETKRKAEKYERMMNLRSLQDAEGSKLQVGGSSGSTHDGGSGHHAVPGTNIGHTSATAQAVAAYEQATAPLHGGSRGQHQSSKNGDPLSNWDPRQFTVDFCRSADEDGVDALRVLNVDQLKALVLCLKGRCNMQFDAQAEKIMVREEVMRDLTSHPTVEYLRFLETEVDSYKAKLADEAVKTRNLKVALSSSHIQKDVAWN
ncbi:unnamed protein product [Amoebophrya sp. A25]|nr:unnamed protein product [Amoebophrya sp. A25]|eukprot:GSA25T00010556001.1